MALDIGCGVGVSTFELARRGWSALGVDAAPAALKVAGILRQREPPAAFLQADVKNLPIVGGTAGLVLAADFTEHLDDSALATVLWEARRALKPGGRLVIYTQPPSHLFEWLRRRGWLLEPDPTHIGLRSADDLTTAVARAGFVVERVTYLPSHIPILAWLERRLAARVPLLRRNLGLVAS